MERIVAFDLETIADKAMLEFLPEVKPKGNLKDPKKIEEDIKNKKISQVLDMGMDPALNMICCAAWSDNQGNTKSLLLKDESAKAEKDLIMGFWEVMEQYDHFVTYNGRDFDMRCLLLHGMSHGIRPSVNIDKGRYNCGNHTDLRGVLAGEGAFAKGKLDFFAQKFLGRGKTEGIDGSQVQTYWDLELYDEIAKYNEDDAVLTMDLFQMAKTAGLLE